MISITGECDKRFIYLEDKTYCIYYLDLGRCPGIVRPASGGMPLPQSAAHPPFLPASLLRNGRKRSSVAYELRLRAVAEARREAALRLRMVALRVAIGLLALAATLSVTLIGASAKGARASSLGNLHRYSSACGRCFVCLVFGPGQHAWSKNKTHRTSTISG